MALVWLLRGVLLGLTGMKCLVTIMFLRYVAGAGARRIFVFPSLLVVNYFSAGTMRLSLLKMDSKYFICSSEKSEMSFNCA